MWTRIYLAMLSLLQWRCWKLKRLILGSSNKKNLCWMQQKRKNAFCGDFFTSETSVAPVIFVEKMDIFFQSMSNKMISAYNCYSTDTKLVYFQLSDFLKVLARVTTGVAINEH